MCRRRGCDLVEQAGADGPGRREDDCLGPKELTVREADLEPASASVEGDGWRLHPDLDPREPPDRPDQGPAELSDTAGQADCRDRGGICHPKPELSAA